MSKKILAIVLCALMLLPCLASCARDENYVGPIINMYLSEMVYDFDPLYAYNNESVLKVVSLLYEPLFRLNDKGKVEKALVKDYSYKADELNNEYVLTLKLNQTYWSDGTYVSSNDVVFAWKRIMDPENSNEAACLLYDLKNGRSVKSGDSSIDTLGIYSVDELEVQVEFEYDIDVDKFLYNLTSYALVPLREDIVAKNADWAKKGATIVCSGPFILRGTDYGMDPRVDEEDYNRELVLERNIYYFRDKNKDNIDKAVTPYKIKITFEKTPEEQIDLFNAGELFYVNYIPLSKRAELQSSADVFDVASSHSYIFNTEALIQKNGSTEGEAIFANANVRKALSMAIDRNAIAAQIVYARPATGFVPYKIMAADKINESYRDSAPAYITTSANVEGAKALLAEAGINPADYTFTISYRSNKEVHKVIADAVAAVWTSLGFTVNTAEIAPIVNNDLYFEELQQDICDDVFNETYFYRHPQSEKEIRSFEVLAVDIVATSVDAFSVLAPYALKFSGQGMDLSSNVTNDEETDGEEGEDNEVVGDVEYELTPHISNYNSEEYNAKIEEAFAEKDPAKRLELLKQAEEILVRDMPVMPIIFNQNARLVSNELSNIKYSWTGYADFRKTMLKDFERFAETTEPLPETLPAA